jgi:hypothetical protein
MSIEAMKQALEALEYPGPSWPESRERAAQALRTAIEQAEKQEPVAWLTKELMADYLDMIAEAIADNKSETLRHKAYWMRKGDV